MKSYEENERVKMDYYQLLAEERDKYTSQVAEIREQHEQQLA